MSRSVESASPVGGPLLAAKPLMRGWLHAGAAGIAVAVTILLAVRSTGNVGRMLALVVFGLSMVELYTVSATYHLGNWSAVVHRRLRAVDHANIFVMIAGTYTPLCWIVLSGWLRPVLLIAIWVLAITGVGLATLSLRAPRWLVAGLYVGMGWVSVFALPAFAHALGILPTAILIVGGVLYTVGAIVYARKWPNPFPKVFGFHEVFHTFVIAGSAAFTVVIWLWVVPFLPV